MYNGACVGASWITLEAFGLVPTVGGGQSAGVVAETVLIIAFDALLLTVASVGGWLSQRR